METAQERAALQILADEQLEAWRNISSSPGKYASEKPSMMPRKRPVRASILGVRNGWLIEYEGEQFVFKDEKELAEFFTARRVQNALEGK